MGKIRIKELGDEKKEKEQKARDEARRESKKAALKTETEVENTNPVVEEKKTETKAKKTVQVSHLKHSRHYLQIRTYVDKTKQYSISEAIELLKKMKRSSFDETVEVHINTIDKGIKGNVSFPHSTGKTTRIAIVDDNLIKEIEKGVINFDTLIAHPSYMGKLARLAKILGPKGLMPNPKNGTISETPEATVKKLAGSSNFKTEPNFPLIHTFIGKISFPDKNLEENFKTLIKAIGVTKIVSVFVKTTMSPSVKIQFNAE